MPLFATADTEAGGRAGETSVHVGRRPTDGEGITSAH